MSIMLVCTNCSLSCSKDSSQQKILYFLFVKLHQALMKPEVNSLHASAHSKIHNDNTYMQISDRAD
jgi:hypothetical protein